MTTLYVLLALGLAAYFGNQGLKAYREARRKEADGWTLVGWRTYGHTYYGAAYELRFKNGTVIREGNYYPTGESAASNDFLWHKILQLETQIEWGKLDHLRIPDDS